MWNVSVWLGTPCVCLHLVPYRKVHRERELAFECSAKLYHNASPADVGVPLKLFPQDPGLLHGSYPYESAVQELKLLLRDCCPQRKLECIGESDPTTPGLGSSSLSIQFNQDVDFLSNLRY